LRGARRVDAGWTAGEHDAAKRVAVNRVQVVVGEEFRPDADFADAPGDELTVLRPEIEDRDGLVSARCGDVRADAGRVRARGGSSRARYGEQ